MKDTSGHAENLRGSGGGARVICEASLFPQSAGPHPTHSCTPNSFLQEIRSHVQASSHPPCTLCILIW